MKIIMHAAVSIDNFVAKPDGDADWVSPIDTNLFEQRCLEMGCVVVGRKTFVQLNEKIYPAKGVTNIVLTSSQKLPRDREEENIYFANSVEKAIEIAKSKGHERVMVGGGGRTNGSFLSSGLIDEVFLSVHPIVLNKGIKLFEGVDQRFDFKLVGTRELGGGLVELHYEK